MHKYLSLYFLLFAVCLSAQNTGLPLESPGYQILERLEIKSGIRPEYHPALKYYSRKDIIQYALYLDTMATGLSTKDRDDLNYLFKDNNEWLHPSRYATTLTGKREPTYQKIYVDSTQTFYTIERTSTTASTKHPYYFKKENPVWNTFYKTPANFLEFDQEHVYIKVNPIINFRLANANNNDGTIFLNQRGITVRGGIDDRIYFHTRILEQQARFPDYVRDFIADNEAVPGAGLYKPYNSQVFDINNGFDFLLAQGYIGFNVSRHVGVQFGHGRNFIGNGYRSMLLSDFANNYFYLKLNTRVWKLHYQNIFAELNSTSQNANPGNNFLPKKYMAAHYLSYQPSANFSIGVFEGIIFSRENQFEFQYLNPIVFYRTIEGGLDSPDNVLIGLNTRLDIFKRVRLYGQVMLDEFFFKKLFIERRGWWANKYGIQLGLKYIDAFKVDHLDVGFEFNTARPFTYLHRDSTANYTHQNQSLTHPLGTNFKEFLFNLRYQPHPKFVLDARYIVAEYGRNVPGQNTGGDILLSYENRVFEFGNETGQGINNTINTLSLNLSYQLFHNGFIDLYYFQRVQDSDDESLNRTTSYFGGGFRMNIDTKSMEF